MRIFTVRGSHRVGWLMTGVLASVTAGWGIMNSDLYRGLIAAATRPGALSQDVVSLIAGLGLCGLAARTRGGPKTEVIALGLLGFLFYGYGIYVIERVYNFWYLNYLAIFGIGAWLLVLGAVDVVRNTADQASLPRRLRRVSAAGAFLQPIVFYPMWIGLLIPLMVHRNQIDSLYSIFILDLVFIMPAFLLVAIGLMAARGWALVLAPVMFVIGAVLMFSLALGEIMKPAFRLPTTTAGLVPPILLTILFVALAVVNLVRLSFRDVAVLPTGPGPLALPPSGPQGELVTEPTRRPRARLQKVARIGPFGGL
jgi:hypothetical protein